MMRDVRRFEQLALAHGPKVLAYLARRVSLSADAADVHQEVLVTAWRKLDRIPADDGEALAWLIGTARRCLANHRRTTHRRSAATERFRAVVVLDPGSPGPFPAVRAAVDDLRPKDREVLTLAYWDDLSTEQIASVLGINGAAVRKRLQRARERVRAHLETSNLGERIPVPAA